MNTLNGKVFKTSIEFILSISPCEIRVNIEIVFQVYPELVLIIYMKSMILLITYKNAKILKQSKYFICCS